MRVLVLGGAGMLGHKMVQRLARGPAEVWWTVRSLRGPAVLSGLNEGHCIGGLDLSDWPQVGAVLARLRPDVVVNCAGVIKQRADAARPIPSLTINSLLPHRLAESQDEWRGRVIHVSTDCVFSGRRGSYVETDQSDAEDLYGRSKFLGEVAGPNALTLRTSIIGRELAHHHSLLDWLLLGGHERVHGFTRVWWSGVTTNHLADLVARLLSDHPKLSGLHHVSSGRISKYDLLCRIREAFGLKTVIEPDDGPVNDRSLNGSLFASAIGYVCPSWDELIAQLAGDPTPYVTQQFERSIG